MNSFTQILDSLKALYTSVLHEINWWVWSKINVVFFNSLKALFIRRFSFFKLKLHFLRFAMIFLYYYVPRKYYHVR